MIAGPPSVSKKPPPRASFSKFQAWLGILLSLACLVWLVWKTDWAGVWVALGGMDYWLALLALLINLGSVFLRAARWRLMFRAPRVPPFGKLVAALLVGQAVNVLAPARLGDLARATLVGPGETGYTLGTLVVEIALDLLMLAVLIVLLLSQVTLPSWWRGSGQALLAISTIALAGVGALVVGRRWVTRLLERLSERWPYPWMRRILTAAEQLLLSLDTLGQPARLFSALAWSVMIWLSYAAVNYTLLGAIGESPSILAALFLLAVLQLGVAVPSSPGRLGVFHYLCVQALGVFGIEGSEALSYAFVLHLISVVLPMALGAALAWRLGVQFGRAPQGLEGG